MKLRQIILEYFTFTKNERIGLAVLLGLILIVFLANQFIFYFETPGTADHEKFRLALAELEQKQDNRTEKLQGKLFNFNPNTIDATKLDSLLLPAGVKQNLLKYRNKGGSFYKVDQFRKIYGMNDSIFDAVKPYIQIEASPKRNIKTRQINNKVDPVEEIDSVKPQKVVQPKKWDPQTLEINKATPDELIKLQGIGPVFSERIVKYRNLLGGFVSFEQLHEVYGLEPETIENILPYLTLDTSLVTQLNINFIEAAQLVKHPYINWDLANALVDFRSKNGFIDEIHTLQNNTVLNESNIQRIFPYLKTKD